jgi:hypothetical protein
MFSLELARIINDERQTQIEARLRQRGLLRALAERAAEGRSRAVELSAGGHERESGSTDPAFARSDRLSALQRQAGE